MNDADRDDIIRRALTPAEDVHVPPGLLQQVAGATLVTPQERRRTVTSMSALRWLSAFSPATLLLLMLGLMVGAAIGAALLLSVERRAPSGVLTNRGDAGHTGVLAGPGPSGMPMVEWDVPVGRELLSYTMPLIQGDTVYTVHAKGGVRATDLASGEPRWEAELGSDVSGTPHIVGDLLVVGALDGTVHALALADGSPRWRQALQVPVGAPIAGWEDLALAGSESGSLQALDIESGIVRWSVQLDGPVRVAPAIESGTVIAVADGGHVLAMDAGSGRVEWEHWLGVGQLSTPAVRENVLYITFGTEGGGKSGLVALEVRPGPDSVGQRELWRWPAPTTERLYLAAVEDDMVYVTGHQTGVYAIDAATGSGGLLLPTPGSVGPTAVIVGDDLYVGSSDRIIRAADRRSGEVHWSIEVPGDPTSPVVYEGRVVVGTSLGRLVAITGQPLSE